VAETSHSPRQTSQQRRRRRRGRPSLQGSLIHLTVIAGTAGKF